MAAPSQLADWQNFYVIVGSSAGALTGLQFVVIALITDARAARSMLEIRAFGTPTIVHFCVALLICAIGSAPWQEISQPGFCLAICGAAGSAYSLRVISHTRKQTGYAPDAGDWFWYAVLPFVGYATLLAGGIMFAWRPAAALFVVAGAALLLMFNGIHNAWDTVTFIAIGGHKQNPGKR